MTCQRLTTFFRAAKGSLLFLLLFRRILDKIVIVEYIERIGLIRWLSLQRQNLKKMWNQN